MIKSHQKEISPAKILAKFRKGDLVGGKYDDGINKKAENWVISRGRSLVVVFEEKKFDELWEHQKSRENEV